MGFNNAHSRLGNLGGLAVRRYFEAETQRYPIFSILQQHGFNGARKCFYFLLFLFVHDADGCATDAGDICCLAYCTLYNHSEIGNMVMMDTCKKQRQQFLFVEFGGERAPQQDLRDSVAAGMASRFFCHSIFGNVKRFIKENIQNLGDFCTFPRTPSGGCFGTLPKRAAIGYDDRHRLCFETPSDNHSFHVNDIYAPRAGLFYSSLRPGKAFARCFAVITTHIHDCPPLPIQTCRNSKLRGAASGPCLACGQTKNQNSRVRERSYPKKAHGVARLESPIRPPTRAGPPVKTLVVLQTKETHRS